MLCGRQPDCPGGGEEFTRSAGVFPVYPIRERNCSTCAMEGCRKADLGGLVTRKSREADGNYDLIKMQVEEMVS